MRILFLTDNFSPETNAPATRTFEHARGWVSAGHEVTVLTNVPNFPTGVVFPGYRNALWQEENVEGIRVVRVWTYITANEGFFRRTLDYFSFLVSGLIGGMFLPRPDIVAATSPQIFTVVAGWLLACFKRRPFVFELRDLWPDSIVAVGAMRNGLAIRTLRRLEEFLYAHAARIVVVSPAFKRILVNRGVPAAKIGCVPNGVDLRGFGPGAAPEALARRFGVNGRFVAAYVGTIGMAHGLGTLLDAAALLQDRKDIVFLLVGTGAEHAKLQERARLERLDNVRFAGSVDKDTVKDVWRLADVALVLLRDSPTFAHVIPSKLFEAMGSGCPIVLGLRGESEGLLNSSGAGIAIPPDDPGALADAVVALWGDPVRRKAMAVAGRLYVETHYDRSRLAAIMLEELRNAAASGG